MFSTVVDVYGWYMFVKLFPLLLWVLWRDEFKWWIRMKYLHCVVTDTSFTFLSSMLKTWVFLFCCSGSKHAHSLAMICQIIYFLKHNVTESCKTGFNFHSVWLEMSDWDHKRSSVGPEYFLQTRVEASFYTSGFPGFLKVFQSFYVLFFLYRLLFPLNSVHV